MKFGRMVDLGGYQVISPFGELWPRVRPKGEKAKNYSNAHLIGCLCNRAEILQDGGQALAAGIRKAW